MRCMQQLSGGRIGSDRKDGRERVAHMPRRVGVVFGKGKTIEGV